MPFFHNVTFVGLLLLLELLVVFFWIAKQSVQLAEQLGQLLAVPVPQSPFHKTEAVSSPRSTVQVVDKIVGSRKSEFVAGPTLKGNYFP